MSRLLVFIGYCAVAGAVGWFVPHALPFLGFGGAALVRGLTRR